MQRDLAHLSELTHLIYGAALHPEQWENVVTAIAASFECSQCLLLTPYLGPQHGGFYFYHGIEETYVQLYATNYLDKNVWTQSIEQRGWWRDGEVFTGDELVPRNDFLASPFYQEFLRPQGTAHACHGVVFAGSVDFPAVLLDVFRDLHEPEFDEEDKAWMRLLVAHVSRSLGLMLRLETARIQNSALLASFERLDFGVAMLDEDMRVVHLNRAAKLAVARDDGLRVNPQQRLEGSTSPGHDPAQGVAHWLDNLRDTPLSEQAHFLQGAMVARTLGDSQNASDDTATAGKRYSLQCAPLPRTDVWFAQQQGARYVVFITDPDVVQRPSDERLIELYGLTTAQAKVTCELAQGASYKEVAQRLQVSIDTVRSHVKEIYRKTRVNRQSDLVHLMLSISQSGV